METPKALSDWAEATATTSLLVRAGGSTVAEVNRPIEAAGRYGIDGTLREGQAVENEVGLPYRRIGDRMQHDVASTQKSIVSVLTAIAVDLGLLSFDDDVSRHLDAGWSRAGADHEASVTIRHLLSMTSGLDDKLEAVAPVGDRWWYSLGPVWHQMKRILVAASGLSLDKLTIQWLTDPLQMHETAWISRPGMTYIDSTPVEALQMTAQDLALFGQMVLDGGARDGSRVVSETNLEVLLKPSQPLNPAYGLLWWLNGQTPRLQPLTDEPAAGVLLPSAPSDTVAAIGALGQICMISKSADAVVVRMGGPRPGVGMDLGADIANEAWSVVSLELDL